jgi:glycosyltransferase involved in cell wall biosynthesis
MSNSPVTIGLEITNYALSKVSTGIQNVISSFHNDLELYWRSRGIDLVPTICQKASNRDLEPILTSASLGGDFFKKKLVSPEDCQAIILPDIDNGIDFQRLKVLSTAQRIPVIAFVYDILPLLHSEWFPVDGKRNFQIWLQQTLHATSHLVVNTEKTRSDLNNLPWKISQKVSVVRLGSRLELQVPEKPFEDRISVLYVSTIEPRKGHDLILEAFDLLRSWGCDVVVTFVGHRGWKIDELIDQIRNHPEFGSRLKWYEGGSDDLIRKLAMEANIGVMPSRGEGFGLFIEEGLAMGLKVIASEIPEFLERTQPNLFFSQLDGLALANSILQVHETPLKDGFSPRTMHDFTFELSQLIESIVLESE